MDRSTYGLIAYGLIGPQTDQGSQPTLWWSLIGPGLPVFRGLIHRRIDRIRPPYGHAEDKSSSLWSISFQTSIKQFEALRSICSLSIYSASLTPRVILNVASQSSSAGNSLDSDRQIRHAEPAYSFVGMHCIFDNCRASATIVKFGHMSSNLLAYGASDGSLTICNASEQPSLSHQLKGHSKAITDFDFSSNNQYIASSSMDKTVRVWDVSKGHCMRIIYGVSPQLCIRFHPVNNNLLSVGNGNKEINELNFSTGHVVTKLLFENEITAMDNDHTGQHLFAGDAQGCIYSVKVNSHTGAISRSHKNRSIRSKSPITTVQYRTFSFVARGPVLLACARDGNICFFSVALEVQGYLTLLCSLKLAPRSHNIGASFCPLLSLGKGEFVVSGSEDANVYFYDLTRPKHACVNKLQGHGSTVIGVAWNHGENLLASSDSDGTVIVWKRAQSG
ncbi:hypothetical protein ZIOFF_033830 [Zingiber officinale]|uniref:Uncharacterized protein n=1 Tax=Zingiber officinale TaxID=94328 RepID=A0A8J5GKU7_ZINOF|nr:hypothetical protein ZIOFF_033830 [Zingiber officinale]